MRIADHIRHYAFSLLRIILTLLPPNAKELLIILSTQSTHDVPQEIEADYLVCAIGRVPQTGFYTSSLIRVKEELKCQGIFYEIGDVINGIFRQAAIACGNGIQIAMKIQR